MASYAARRAFDRVTGRKGAFGEAWARYRDSCEPISQEPAGEDFDFDDAHQMRRRLPRLSAIFLPGEGGRGRDTGKVHPARPGRQLHRHIRLGVPGDGHQVIRSAVQAPRMKSVMERWIGNCRCELLDRILVRNQRHLMIVLREYEDFSGMTVPEA